MSLFPGSSEEAGDGDELLGHHPTCCLTISATSVTRRISTLMHKHDLRLVNVAAESWSHLETAVRGEGDHKGQAVRLFMAALELFDPARGVSQLLLQEVSQLHRELAWGTGLADWRRYTPGGQAARWFPQAEGLVLCPAVQLHLRQAGFAVPAPQSQPVVLMRLHIARIIDCLLASRERARDEGGIQEIRV